MSFYLGGPCDQSRNSQNSTCTALNGGPLPTNTNTQVVVTCVEQVGGSLISTSVVPGGSEPIRVIGFNDDSLPDFLECTVTTEDGTELQSVVINTSSNADLFLKDVYGSLELVSCTDDKDNTRKCLVLQRTRNSKTFSLTERVSDRDIIDRSIWYNIGNDIDIGDVDGGDPNLITTAIRGDEPFDLPDNNFVDERLGSICGNVTEDLDNDEAGDEPIPGVLIDGFIQECGWYHTD